MRIINNIYINFCAFACKNKFVLYKQAVLGLFLLQVLYAENLFVFGTFDFNQNGKSEIIKINNSSTVLEFVEIENSGEHTTIWSYSLDNENKIIVDIKLNDINNDNIPEIIVIEANNFKNSWIKIFEWNGYDFSSNINTIINKEKTIDKIRPSNLAVQSKVFAVSKSSPTRSVTIFSLNINDGMGQITNSKTHVNPIVTNGYGPVFTGLFSISNKEYGVLMSPEGNVLKLSVFTLDDPNESFVADLAVTNGARVILGPYIQSFDDNKDGREDLLIPFATGEVYKLSIINDSLSFSESKFSEKGLFDLQTNSTQAEINNAILSRINSGLYHNQSTNISSTDSTPLLVPSDTIMLGDTLKQFILPDLQSIFYSFKWESSPPKGMFFNPKSATIEWAPKTEDIGFADYSYMVDIRLNEEIISSTDPLGDMHQLAPILKTLQDSTILYVADTTKIPEPLIVIPPMFHGVTVSSRDISDTSRFTFRGETPFSAKTINNNKLVTIGVSANLSTIKQNKSGTFNFQSSEKKPDSLITLSLIHDLSSNIFYASIAESKDTLNQSFDPEGWKSNLYEFPEYFFEGFPKNMEIEQEESGDLSLLASDKNRSGSLVLHSPLFSKDHSLSLSYFGGRPYAVRGKVNVKEDGSHKTITEIDFESSFDVLDISAKLSPANRDTFVFAHDEIPDTLKASINYRSFYSPVTILKERAKNDSTEVLFKNNKETKSDSLTSPIILQKETAVELDTTISLPNDTLIVVPETEAPALLDSIKTEQNEALIDSIK